ncbi:hypothetical protein CAter282_1072 [Collimonas arenae]|uniref:Uncharacterized protein n=1 Tax=Collimonas arenae TaxID=279058 RepID=A0A127PN00_9BURK|nr:hypothetical protein [Collimonas arenae]AMO98974.1 hypothetical protein CAter10_1160 [Collimonas arenae]AMP08867.1 hypothetical protein CAter282_1072 [Collimonas arenae]
MASISPPLPLSTRSMQAQAHSDNSFHAIGSAVNARPSWIEKILTVWTAPYKRLSGSFLRF